MCIRDRVSTQSTWGLAPSRSCLCFRYEAGPALLTEEWKPATIERLTELSSEYHLWPDQLLTSIRKASSQKNFVAAMLWLDYSFKNDPENALDFKPKPEPPKEVYEWNDAQSVSAFDLNNEKELYKEQLVKSCLLDENEENIEMGPFLTSARIHHEDQRSGAQNPSEGDIEIEELSNSEMGVSVYRNNTILIQSYFARSFRSSFFQQNMLMDRARMTSLYKKFYKEATTLIEKHIRTPKNVFYTFFRTFSDYLKTNYSRPSDFANAKERLKEAGEDIVAFLQLLYESMRLYYRFDFLCKRFEYVEVLFSKDNFVNFLVSIFFTDPSNHTVINDLLKKINAEDIELTRRGLDVLKSADYETFSVSVLYRLNEESVAEISSLLAKKRASENESTTFRSFQKQTLTGESTRNEYSEVDEYKAFLFEKPYEKSVKVLRKITKYTSPLHKMKVILEFANSINQEISAFFKQHQFYEHKVLDGDDIFAIILYLIVKAGLPEMICELEFISMFTTRALQNSIIGYYSVSIEASLQFIKDKGALAL
eukprot:TRINITY_DN8704_c0_g1_i6.p1 TRINITY_DN8704_c0_g1~~TRINITY_DN8704_c0_g1_i6.p1  ORF type:complete len:538 (+),score=133.15 TRINITY_DN8704_c0_g1_i6:65-1678(+)